MGFLPGSSLFRSVLTFGPPQRPELGSASGRCLMMLLDGTDLELPVNYETVRRVVSGRGQSLGSNDVSYDPRRGWWEVTDPGSDLPILIPHSAVARILPLTDAMRLAIARRDGAEDEDPDEPEGPDEAFGPGLYRPQYDRPGPRDRAPEPDDDDTREWPR